MNYSEAFAKWGRESSQCRKCTCVGPHRVRYQNHVNADWDGLTWYCSYCGVEVGLSRTADHDAATCKRACCTR